MPCCPSSQTRRQNFPFDAHRSLRRDLGCKAVRDLVFAGEGGRAKRVEAGLTGRTLQFASQAKENSLALERQGLIGVRERVYLADL